MLLSTHVQHPLPNLSGQKSPHFPKEEEWVSELWRKIRSIPSNMFPLESVVKPHSPALLTLLVMEI